MRFPIPKNKAILSPMAGVTDFAFRKIAKEYGAGITYTEFVNSISINKENPNSERMLRTSEIEKPVGVQLFGNNENDIIEAALKIENDFDIIDINCGCPAWKVIRTGAGSELLKNPEKISIFVNKLVSKISKPVTVKIRSGIDEKNINAVSIAKIIEDAGAEAISIHGRTQKQGYSGKSDWDIIKNVKNSVNIPVIGNGDVFTPEDFKNNLEYSGVDMIMIARGAIGNPYIFKQITDYMENNEYSQPDRIKDFMKYLKYSDDIKLKYIKSHAASFIKNMEGGNKIRNTISKCHNMDEIKNIFENIDI